MAIDPIALALSKCNPNAALEPDDERFVDFDSIRGFTLRQRLSRLLAAAGANPDQYVHAAVAGHRGSGKSTELNRAFAELRDANYLVLGASVNENLDPHDISFSDIMRLIVLLLDDAFAEDARKNDSIAKAFAVVREWFRDVTRSSETAINNATEMSAKAALGGKASLEGGVDAGATAKARTDLGELVAAIGVVRRSQSSESTQVKETIERYNNELVSNINLLLQAVKIGAPEKLGQGLVLLSPA